MDFAPELALEKLDHPFDHETIVAEGLSYADFLRQFDGQHAEWFEGKVILVMANSSQHQLIQALLSFIFTLYFGSKPIGTFRPAPFSMRVSSEMPRREPDLMIVLNENRERLQATFLDGAADIAIEIVSQESLERDYYLKFNEYEAAGVREYWIIDPLRRLVDILTLDETGKYIRLPLDNEGRFYSKLLPNFKLNPALLWQTDLPQQTDLFDLIQQMTT